MSAARRFGFLMGSERSGSNLATRMLGHHPNVSAPTPTHLFRLILGNLPRYGDLRVPRQREMLRDDVLALFETKLGDWRIDATAREIISAADEHAPARLIAALYEAEADAEGAQHVFVKENQIHSFFPMLESAFPEARYLYVVRDPRDMALSWKQAKAMRGGVVRACDVWRQDQDAFLAMHSHLVAAGRCLAVRYESLVADPEAVLGEVCGFLGLDYAPEMLDFHTDGTTRKAARIADWRNLGAPVRGDNFGKFRDGLGAEEIRFVEAATGDLMRAFGYAPVTDASAGEAAGLREALLPNEPMTKPGFDEVSDFEKRTRHRRQRIVAAIEARPAAPAIL